MQNRKTAHIVFRSQFVLLVSAVVFAFLLAAFIKSCTPKTAYSGDKRQLDTRR